MRRVLLALGLLLLPLTAGAQCAMCRKNAENANPGFAKGLRVGIAVLFVMPYLIVGTLGWIIYKRMKQNAQRVEAGAGDGGEPFAGGASAGG
ncbi:MAG: hypothetical protein NZ580_06585 [Bacteroidia bacterium]|nr:hypothetical protein [Bacteroidia bacterium]MDW8235168.1 hypothetical protein [Bacteroidia bacterium]